MAIRILLADDQRHVRRGLRMFLSLDPELIVIGEASSGLQTAELTDKLSPDVILMDILMPFYDGIETIALMRAAGISTPIIALSQAEDPGMISEVMAAGANAYLPKVAAAEKLIPIIKSVSAKG